MPKVQLSKLQLKDWDQLTDPERERVWEELDRLGPDLDKLARPLTKTELQRFAKMPTKTQYDAAQAARGPWMPRIGKGSKRVLICVEKGLLAKADRFAKHHNITRSELIARALERVVGRAG